MAKAKFYTGINIQYPISQLIVSGKKRVETRAYPIPTNYLGKDMLLVETPGKEGKFKARMIAVIRFGKSFQYPTQKEFYADAKSHCVTPDSPWAWDINRPKWGWPIQIVRILKTPVPMKKRPGIKYTRNLEL